MVTSQLRWLLLLLLGELVTSRKLTVRYHLLIFMLSECSMALYSAMMLIKLKVPGSFRLFPEATGGRAGGAKGFFRAQESPSASQRLSHEPGQVASALPLFCLPSSLLSFSFSPSLALPLSLSLSSFPPLHYQLSRTADLYKVGKPFRFYPREGLRNETGYLCV